MRIRRVARVSTAALACVSAAAIGLPAIAAAAPQARPLPAGHGAFTAAPFTTTPAAAVRSRVTGLAQKALSEHAGAAHRAAGDAFTVRNVVVDRDGSADVRFDRTYKGLPAYGGDVIVHLAKDGTYQSLATGSQTSGAVSTTPRLAASRAAAVSEGAFRGRIDSVSAPHLAVQMDGGAATLVWETVVKGVRADQTPSRLHVLVDAGTGAVVRTSDEVDTFAAPGDARRAAPATAAAPAVGPDVAANGR
ncbi:MAG: peptidase, partial [Streptomyces sp.]|nr:peptidase [Streptomyces sp.]